MAVYKLAVGAREAVYEQLLADPSGFGIPHEVESAAAVVGFHIHLLWLEHAAVNLIVDGDADPEALAGLLAERLGGGWEFRTAARVYEAEQPPDTLESGEQSQWVIGMAVGPRVSVLPCKLTI